jgi:protein-tyrosine kinase
LGTANRIGTIGQDGDSDRSKSECSSPTQKDGASSEFLSVVDVASAEPPQLSQELTPGSLGPARRAESSNGFRRAPLIMREESRFVFQTDPNGFAAEQFRLLRRRLKQEFATGALLLITSPGTGDGKTFTSVNLGSGLSHSGSATLLVEMDIRRPKFADLLGYGIEPPGLEDALAGKVEPHKAICWIKELNLHTAMVAKTPRNPHDLICGTKHFLEWARKNFAWVVLDTPPVLPSADVSELLPLADAAVLVVRAQITPRELSKRAIEILGKHLRGVIFNEVTVDSNPDYRYLGEYYADNSDGKSAQPQLHLKSKQK